MFELICGIFVLIIFMLILLYLPKKKNNKINQYEEDKRKQILEKRRINILNYYNKIDRLNISDSNKIILKRYIKGIHGYLADSTIKQSYTHIATFLKRTGIEATELDRKILENYLKEYNLSNSTSRSYRFHIGKFYYYAVKGYSPRNMEYWS